MEADSNISFLHVNKNDNIYKKRRLKSQIRDKLTKLIFRNSKRYYMSSVSKILGQIRGHMKTLYMWVP